ncbi:TPM domain-containing protein [Myxococcus faecalis]|uniref:TPM domain-containing protein n=1 Tax=Myxococcus faecalis TaxID=3115646 RepID=UPI003CE8810F
MVKPSLLLLLPLLALVASAESRVPDITRPVVDLADVLSAQDEESISTELVRLRDSTEAQMAVVLVETTSGEPIEDFALRSFDAWKGGSRERNDGLLLVVAVKDRRVRLEVGYGLEEPIPDGVAQALLQAQSPLFARADWRGGILNIVEEIQGRLAEASTTTSRGSAVATPTPRRRSASQQVLFLMLIFGAATAAGLRGRGGVVSKDSGGMYWFLAVEAVVMATSAFAHGLSIVEALGIFGAFVGYFFMMGHWVNSHPPSAIVVASCTPLLIYWHAASDIARAPTLWACVMAPNPFVVFLIVVGVRYTLGTFTNAMNIHCNFRPRPLSLSLRAMMWLGYKPEHLRRHQARLESASATGVFYDSSGSLGGVDNGGWGDGGGWSGGGGGGWSGGGGSSGGGGGSSSF